MTLSGISPIRLARVRDVLERYVEAGHGPGAVAVISRQGEPHIQQVGYQAFEGAGSEIPMASDTIFRIASWTKTIVAACAMTLVEDGTLLLTRPVDALLPELAEMTVLTDPRGPLDDTVPAHRSITLLDLLTCRLGTGTVLAEPGTIPISDALFALERGEDPGDPVPTPDEWIRRLGALPLVSQPGERWMYYISAIVLGTLITRATGKSLEEALRERIFEPLGMKDTGFDVWGEDDLGRLASAYVYDPNECRMVVEGGSPETIWTPTPQFKQAASGLVSTAEDFLAFSSALLAGGIYQGRRVLSRPAVTFMTSDHLSPTEKAASKFIWPPGFRKDYGWGLGMGICTRRTYLGPSAGSYGWYGKYGTTWFNDTAEDLITILMIQTDAYGKVPMWVFEDFWTAVYQAIDD